MSSYAAFFMHFAIYTPTPFYHRRALPAISTGSCRAYPPRHQGPHNEINSTPLDGEQNPTGRMRAPLQLCGASQLQRRPEGRDGTSVASADKSALGSLQTRWTSVTNERPYGHLRRADELVPSTTRACSSTCPPRLHDNRHKTHEPRGSLVGMGRYFFEHEAEGAEAHH